MSGMVPAVETYHMVIAATAANAAFETVVCTAPWAGTVTAVNYIADTALSGANTESRTLQLINKGQAGAGTTIVASLALVLGVNLAAFDAKAITLSATAADLVLVAGDVLAFKSLNIGVTGLADPGGTVVVTLSRS